MAEKMLEKNQLVLFVTDPGQAVCVSYRSTTCWPPESPYPSLSVRSTDSSLAAGVMT